MTGQFTTSAEIINFLCDLSKEAITLNISCKLEKAVKEQEEIHPAKPAAYYRFFYWLASILKPRLCLELGTNKGVAAACLAAGNPDGRVVAVDINTSAIWDPCKLKNIDFVKADSLSPLNLPGPIDILFIDTSSKGSRNRCEYEFWKDKLAKKALVFIDDIFIVKDKDGFIKTDRMAEFWREFNPGWPKLELPLHGVNGFGCVVHGFPNSD